MNVARESRTVAAGSESSMISGACRLLPIGLVVGLVLGWGLTIDIGMGRAQTSPEEIFRVEYNREAVPRGGWAVEGYVNNSSRLLVSGVRLRVEVLDAGGAPIGESFGWVYGNVPAGGRAYFTVSLPRRGADYRITVVSFTSNSVDAP